jgi:hypothetical protein
VISVQTVNMLRAYTVGARLLLKDGYHLYQVRSTPVLTLHDALERHLTHHDLFRGVPILTWFMLPLGIGNIVLLVGFLAPSWLPLSWQPPRLRANVLKRAEQRALAVQRSLPSPQSVDFVARAFGLYYGIPSFMVIEQIYQSLNCLIFGFRFPVR